MIIGTAGHVDHGKTALVKALTGTDTDRLPEEKRRGITLELGFAQLSLPGAGATGANATGAGVMSVGVVDVPGHERFVRAMAAGAGGVDLALLVVAADEGVMPQTREHLDICRLLGVRQGVIALTKSDLLPGLGPDWRELLMADLAELTRDSFLEGAPVVEVSARTGEGLEALKAALARAAHALGATRPVDGPVFLPVDRAFSLKGFGTVVTGTLLSGTLAAEEPVALLPAAGGAQRPLRVRGLQSHGRAQARVEAGARVAVNLADVEVHEVRRGMVLTRAGELPEARTLDVELTALPALPRALPRRQKLLLHLGTAQAQATVALLDLPALAPGETGLAQLRLAEPLAALVGQRFILRASRALPGRGATVAGGRVLAVATPRRRRGAAELLAPLREGDAAAQVTWLLEQAGYRGLTQAELFGRSGLAPRVLARALELLGARAQVVLVDRERRLFLAARVLEGVGARVLALLERFHAEEPAAEGLAKEALRQHLGEALEPRAFARVLAGLQEAGRVEVEHERVRLPGRGGALSGDEADLRTRALALLAAGGLAPPTVGELAAALGLGAPRLLALVQGAVEAGTLVRVSEELLYDAGVLGGLRERLVAHLREKKDISTQAFKEMVGQTRKFVIPLSEYFDREKVTLRVGDKRVLRRG